MPLLRLFHFADLHLEVAAARHATDPEHVREHRPYAAAEPCLIRAHGPITNSFPEVQ
jgi:hypothetical protein